MPKNHHNPEEVVAKLRQVDVLVSQGQPVDDAIRSIGVPRSRAASWGWVGKSSNDETSSFEQRPRV